MPQLQKPETVAELIARLQKLPQDLPVYHTWDCCLYTKPIDVEEQHLLLGDSESYAHVDYFPELELDADDNETRIKAVVIG